MDAIDFDPSCFIAEMTESLMKDLDYIELVTKELNEHNIRIAIDDFGTGYSSLSVLGNTYIDMIKVGKNLDSTIVAEGVMEYVRSKGNIEN